MKSKSENNAAVTQQIVLVVKTSIKAGPPIRVVPTDD